MSELAVSVVIPARNAERSLPPLLQALEHQSVGPSSFETIVADDASTDGTAQRAAAGGARVVSMPRRGGSYAARNLGLTEARADVLAFVDADCVPEEHWLEHGIADLDRLEADVLGGRVEPRLGPDPGIVELVDLARCLDQELCVNDAGYAATANVFVRKRVFDAIGPFNGALVSGGDVEFSLRATEAGFRLAYSERTEAFHPLRVRPMQLVKKGLRTGFGSGQWEHLATGPLRAHRATWRSRASYRPERGILHYGRAGRLGASAAHSEQAADLAHYAFLQLPRVLGSLAASARRGRLPFRP